MWVVVVVGKAGFSAAYLAVPAVEGEVSVRTAEEKAIELKLLNGGAVQL